MRLKIPILFALAAAVVAVMACVQASAQATKGYELYSWKVKGHWYYALLPRSTGSTTYAEITSSKSVRRGTSGLEAELRRLNKGEEVIWMGDAPATAVKPARETLDLKHPSRQRIKRIKAICNKLGLKLTLA